MAKRFIERLKQSGEDATTDVSHDILSHGHQKASSETDKRDSSAVSHGTGSDSLYWVFHVRHAWSNLHQSSCKQPWEFSMTSANSDSLEPWKKRLKVAGNL